MSLLRQWFSSNRRAESAATVCADNQGSQAQIPTSKRLDLPAQISLDSFPDAIYLLDPANLRIVGRNRRAAEMDGYSETEMLHMTAMDLHPQEEHSVIRQGCGSSSEGNQPSLLRILHHRRKDGILVPVEETQALIDAGGEKTILSIVHDLTEYQRAEEALRETEERYRMLAESMPQLVWTCLPDGQCDYLSPQWVEYTGIPEKGQLGYGWVAQMHPDDRQRVQEAWTASVKAGTIFDIEFRIRRADGEHRWFKTRAVPARDSDGQIVKWFGSNTDIHDGKGAEEKLRESEEQFRTLANAIPTLCWMANADGWIFWYNQRWYEYTGTTAQEMEGWGWQSVHDPETLPKVLERWRASIATGEPFEMVFPLRGADGVFRPFLTRVVPILNQAGKPVRWFGTNTDITEQKRAEALLERYFDVSPDLHLTVDYQGCIMRLNRAWAELLGYSRSELIGKSFLDLLHPDDREASEAEMRRLAGGARTINFENRYQTRDGSIRWFLWNAKADLEERLVYAAGRDITERKRALDALHDSEARYRTMVETIPQLVFMKSRDYRWISINENCRRSLGIDSASILGKTNYDLFPKELADKYQADDEKVVQTGVTLEFDEEYIEGGERRIVHTIKTPVKDESGAITGMLGMLWDVTQQRRAEVALLESKRRLDLAQQAGRIGTWDWLIPEKKILWTAELEALYGLPPGGFAGKLENWSLAVHPDDREHAKDMLLKAVDSKTDFDTEFRVVWPDGSIHWMAARGTGYYSETGQPLRMIGTNVDITERKRAEEEVRKLNEQLEQRVQDRTAELEAANKELEAFNYSVSHDLRAPLRHIDGFSRLLVEQHLAELNPETQEYLTTIRESVQQMGVLIDELLNLGRVGRKQLSVQVTGLNSIADEVLTDLKRANPDRAIDWTIQTLPFVECDPGLMKQVFVNLLSNAVKFTRPRNPALIELGATSDGGRPVIFVRDNGVGFSMKYANKLFGVFQRLHRKEDFEGTGVGLATVQRIIHKHRGRVWAEAALDKGATFFFTLGELDEPSPENHPDSGGDQ